MAVSVAAGRMGGMRALVIDSFGSTPSVREVPDPACPEHGVVVRGLDEAASALAALGSGSAGAGVTVVEP